MPSMVMGQPHRACDGLQQLDGDPNCLTCTSCDRSPSITVVGFSWDAADERAMQATFRIGRAQAFRHFLDLQQVRYSSGKSCAPSKPSCRPAVGLPDVLHLFVTSQICNFWAPVLNVCHSSLPDAVHAALCWLLPLGCTQSSRVSFAHCMGQELHARAEQELAGCNLANLLCRWLTILATHIMGSSS